jgi:hypothetical protein
LEALRALQAAKVRGLLKGGLSERYIGKVEGALEILETLGHLPDEVRAQLEAAEKEQQNANRKV